MAKQIVDLVESNPSHSYVNFETTVVIEKLMDNYLERYGEQFKVYEIIHRSEVMRLAAGEVRTLSFEKQGSQISDLANVYLIITLPIEEHLITLKFLRSLTNNINFTLNNSMMTHQVLFS